MFSYLLKYELIKKEHCDRKIDNDDADKDAFGLRLLLDDASLNKPACHTARGTGLLGHVNLPFELLVGVELNV